MLSIVLCIDCLLIFWKSQNDYFFVPLLETRSWHSRGHRGSARSDSYNYWRIYTKGEIELHLV